MTDKKYLCRVCYRPVKARQQAVECDGCGEWVHRHRCTTITAETYTSAVKAGKDIPYICPKCMVSS
jgi:ribosomal protein L32